MSQQFRERERLLAGIDYGGPVKITTDVVRAKAAEYSRRISEANPHHSMVVGAGAKAYKDDTTIIALKPVRVTKAVHQPPTKIFPRTIIPLEARAPTAKLVSDHGNAGFGMPWTATPAALPLLAPALGSLLVMMGRQVAAEIAISGAEEWVNGAKKRYNQRGVQFRFLTGNSPAGKGNIVRPRGKDGSVPEGTDPYEDPDEFTWFKPWTWF